MPTTPLYSIPGYNIFTIIQHGEQTQIVRSASENSAALTLFSDFRPGYELNNHTGITILVAHPYAALVPVYNSLGLNVGDPRLATDCLTATFTDVFGIAVADTFGFGGGEFATTFGVPGSQITFAADFRAQDANRFFAEAHGGMSYVSNSPDLAFVPDGGVTGVMFAVAVGVVALWKKL